MEIRRETVDVVLSLSLIAFYKSSLPTLIFEKIVVCK